jgi:hypothetical protein
VRLEDGDLVASMGDGQLAVYLAHVDPGTATDLATGWPRRTTDPWTCSGSRRTGNGSRTDSA